MISLGCEILTLTTEVFYHSSVPLAFVPSSLLWKKSISLDQPVFYNEMTRSVDVGMAVPLFQQSFQRNIPKPLCRDSMVQIRQLDSKNIFYCQTEGSRRQKFFIEIIIFFCNSIKMSLFAFTQLWSTEKINNACPFQPSPHRHNPYLFTGCMIHFNWLESGTAGEKQWRKQCPANISSIFHAAGKQDIYNITYHKT